MTGEKNKYECNKLSEYLAQLHHRYAGDSKKTLKLLKYGAEVKKIHPENWRNIPIPTQEAISTIKQALLDVQLSSNNSSDDLLLIFRALSTLTDVTMSITSDMEKNLIKKMVEIYTKI